VSFTNYKQDIRVHKLDTALATSNSEIPCILILDHEEQQKQKSEEQKEED
jgi:hypothetical protein